MALTLCKYSSYPAQSFGGFDANDVVESEKCFLSSMIKLSDIPLPEIDEMFVDIYNESDVPEKLQSNTNGNHDQNDDADMNRSSTILLASETQWIVDEIVKNVVGNDLNQDGIIGADDKHNTAAAKDVIDHLDIESILLPKDDPETVLFLSLS